MATRTRTRIRETYDVSAVVAGVRYEFRRVTGRNLARHLIRQLGPDELEVSRRVFVRWQDLGSTVLAPAEVAELLRVDPHDGFNYV